MKRFLKNYGRLRISRDFAALRSEPTEDIHTAYELAHIDYWRLKTQLGVIGT